MKNPVFLARLRAPLAFITSLSLMVGGFAAIPAGAALADGVNLIANPSFELGSAGAPTSWTQSNQIVPAQPTALSTTTPGHTGNSAAQVTITSPYTSGDAKWDFAPVSVVAGQYYTFSDWYKSSTTTSVFMYYTGTCSDGISNAAQGCWMIDGQASTDWNYLSSGFLAPITGTITIAHSLQGPGTLVTDDYSLVQSAAAPIFPSGVVTLTFDDGWQSFSDNATSSLIANGIKATNYIITKTMTADPNCTTLAATDYHLGCYMNTTEIQALQAAGFDIAAHTRNHLDMVKDVASTTMRALYGYSTDVTNPDFWQGEINGSKTDLTTAGFTPVDSFAYPYGSYNSQVEKLVHDAGFLGARSVDQGYNLASTDRYALKMQHVTNTTTAAQIEGWVHQAILDHTWLILMFHDVRAGTETQGSLNAQCVEIADNYGNSYLDASGNPLPTAPNPLPADPDCTTSKVLSDVAVYLANTTNAPAGTVKTMHDVLNGWADTIAPVIVLNGALTMSIPQGSIFTDPGVFRTTDNKDVTVAAPTVTVDSFNGTATTTIPTVNTSVPGTYVLKYTVSDTSANVASTTRAVIVTPVNTPPVATAQSVSVSQTNSVDITLAGTDVDAGQTLTFATTSSPVYGKLVLKSGSVYTYTPNSTTTITNFGDSFKFKANDGIVDSAVATVTITVTPIPVPAPVISGQNQDVGTDHITVNWTTDHAATSRLIWDTVSHPSLGSSACPAPNSALACYGYASTTDENASLVTNHSVTLSGLTAGVTYYVRTVSHGSPEAVGPESVVVTATAGSGGNGGGNSGGGGGGGGGGIVYGTTGGSSSGGVVLGASTQVLTDAQIAAILNLLKSFNADQSVINNVSAALHGQGVATTPGKSDGFVFTQTLQMGSTGNQVTELQKRLTAEGVYSGPVSGYFGALTKAGVVAYQKLHSIPQVGIVGPQTRAVLNGQI